MREHWGMAVGHVYSAGEHDSESQACHSANADDEQDAVDELAESSTTNDANFDHNGDNPEYAMSDHEDDLYGEPESDGEHMYE